MQIKFLTRHFTSIVALAVSAVMAMSPVVAYAGDSYGSLSAEDGIDSIEDISVSSGDNAILPEDNIISSVSISAGDYSLLMEETPDIQPLNEIFPDNYLAIAVASALGISDLSVAVSQEQLDDVQTLTIDTVYIWSGVERLNNLNDIRLNPSSDYDVSNLTGLSAAPCDSLSINIVGEQSIQGDIASFSVLSNLVSLTINFNTNLTGELSSIKNLNKLTNLSIYFAQGVTGSLDDLSGLTDLKCL